MIPITDHVQRGLARVIERWKGSRFVTKLLEAILEEVQEWEDAITQVNQLRTIETAYGTQLDNLGQLVGQRRNGMGDDAYRLRIRARLLINRSSGTAPELIAILKLLVPSSVAVKVREEFPATVVATLDDAAISNGDELASILQEAKAGGVRAILESTPAVEAETFIWNSTTPGQRWNEGKWGSAVGEE